MTLATMDVVPVEVFFVTSFTLSSTGSNLCTSLGSVFFNMASTLRRVSAGSGKSGVSFCLVDCSGG